MAFIYVELPIPVEGKKIINPKVPATEEPKETVTTGQVFPRGTTYKIEIRS